MIKCTCIALRCMSDQLLSVKRLQLKYYILREMQETCITRGNHVQSGI